MTEQSFSLSDSYDSLYQQGKVQNDSKQYEQAITSFDRALQYNPNAHDAWYCKGNALFYLKRYEEAINSYEQATRIQPDSFFAWESYGLALIQLQRYEEAIACLNRALETRSDNYSTFWARGNAFTGLGKTEEAVKDFNKALEINPDAHEIWAPLGQALYYLKRYKQALFSYEKALAFQQETGDRRGEISTLEALTILYPFNGKIQEGFSAQFRAGEIAKGLNLSPDDPLYSLALMGDSIPTESILSAAASLDKMGWMTKLMGFAMKGKLQGSLFIVVWLLFFIGTVMFFPITAIWRFLRKLIKQT